MLFNKPTTRRRAALAVLFFIIGVVAGGLTFAFENTNFQTKDGNYIIYHNAIPSTFLSADIANRFKQKRDQSLGVLTVSVHQNQDSLEGSEMNAISGEAISLLGRKQRLNFRKISEGDAVYYIADFPTSPGDVMRFRLTITPNGISRARSRPLSANFIFTP